MTQNVVIKDRNKEMEAVISFLKTFGAVVTAAALNWLLPIKTFVAVTLLLVFADLITGIQAARKRSEVIHSRGFRRTALKFAMYCTAIISAHGIEAVYFPEFPMVFTISAYVAISEFWSILENVGSVTGVNVLESVRGRLSEILKINQK